MSPVKGCTDTGNGKHGQLHILHPGWLVFSPVDFPAAAARWVPTASVARPWVAVGQNLPPAPAACPVQDAKTNPGPGTGEGKALSVLGCSVTCFCNLYVFKTFMQMQHGAGESSWDSPCMHRSSSTLCDRHPSASRAAQAPPSPCRRAPQAVSSRAGPAGIAATRVPEGCGWMSWLSRQHLPTVTSPTLPTELPHEQP